MKSSPELPPTLQPEIRNPLEALQTPPQALEADVSTVTGPEQVGNAGDIDEAPCWDNRDMFRVREVSGVRLQRDFDGPPGRKEDAN